MELHRIELPSELWHKIMHDLSPIHLMNLREVSRYTAQISQDQTFWYEKVIRTTRRKFQEDWFLFFADMNYGAFLRTIYDLFKRQDWFYRLDEEKIVMALLYMAEDREASAETLWLSVISEQHREIYFGRREDGTLRSARVYNVDLDAAQKNRSKQFIEDGILIYHYISSHPRMQAIERYGLEIFEDDMSGLIFASSSAHLYHFLYPTIYDAKELWFSLQDVLIPHLIEERRFDDLAIYLQDLSINIKRLRTRLEEESIPIEYRSPHINYLLNVIRYSTHDKIDVGINAIRRQFYIGALEEMAVKNNVDRFADVEVFKRVVEKAGIYSARVLSAGVDLMEPEEWIDYLQTLNLTKEQRHEAIKVALQRSLDDGYHYFHRFLQRYEAMMTE